MQETHGSGPLYDQANFPLLGPAHGHGDLGECTRQPETISRLDRHWRVEADFTPLPTEEFPIRLRVRPLQLLAHFVRKSVPARVLARDGAEFDPAAKPLTVWQAIYSYEKGDQPRYSSSAMVAGPRFLQSQVQGPSPDARKRMRKFSYLTKAANTVTCVPRPDGSFGYFFPGTSREYPGMDRLLLS